MKPTIIAVAAALMFVGGPALAQSSFSDGDGFSKMMDKMAAGIDHEASSAVDGMMMDDKQVFQSTMFINGRDARVRYTIENGVKDIVSISYLSSSR